MSVFKVFDLEVFDVKRIFGTKLRDSIMDEVGEKEV